MPSNNELLLPLKWLLVVFLSLNLPFLIEVASPHFHYWLGVLNGLLIDGYSVHCKAVEYDAFYRLTIPTIDEENALLRCQGQLHGLELQVIFGYIYTRGLWYLKQLLYVIIFAVLLFSMSYLSTPQADFTAPNFSMPYLSEPKADFTAPKGEKKSCKKFALGIVSQGQEFRARFVDWWLEGAVHYGIASREKEFQEVLWKVERDCQKIIHEVQGDAEYWNRANREKLKDVTAQLDRELKQEKLNYRKQIVLVTRDMERTQEQKISQERGHAKHRLEEAEQRFEKSRKQLEETRQQLEKTRQELKWSQEQRREQAEEIQSQSDALQSLKPPKDNVILQERIKGLYSEINQNNSSFWKDKHSLHQEILALKGQLAKTEPMQKENLKLKAELDERDFLRIENFELRAKVREGNSLQEENLALKGQLTQMSLLHEENLALKAQLALMYLPQEENSILKAQLSEKDSREQELLKSQLAERSSLQEEILTLKAQLALMYIPQEEAEKDSREQELLKSQLAEKSSLQEEILALQGQLAEKASLQEEILTCKGQLEKTQIMVRKLESEAQIMQKRLWLLEAENRRNIEQRDEYSEMKDHWEQECHKAIRELGQRIVDGNEMARRRIEFLEGEIARRDGGTTTGAGVDNMTEA